MHCNPRHVPCPGLHSDQRHGEAHWRSNYSPSEERCQELLQEAFLVVKQAEGNFQRVWVRLLASAERVGCEIRLQRNQ